jgi:phosphoserine aminotransferase
MSRIYNFNAGPAVLPLEVLETAQAELVDFNNTGMSILESSHRAKAYEAIHNEAIANLRELLGISDDYAVLLLQGGASLQFSMIPMNLLLAGETADYTDSGAWANKAIKEAKKVGAVNIAANCGKEIPTRVPSVSDLKLTPGAKYLHITTNETISGAQWKQFPDINCPLVADMSSDILSRPFDMSRFGLVYAGAQKNLGPSGLTLVIVRKDLAEKAPESLPTMLRYVTHIEENSLYNTPPCFSIYILALVTRWIKKQGRDNLYKQNASKAALIYNALDASEGWYKGTAVRECRSDMNITFRLPSEELEDKFVSAATKAGFVGLKGHRSVGGIRASIYNAFPVQGVNDLVSFMAAFKKANG